MNPSMNVKGSAGQQATNPQSRMMWMGLKFGKDGNTVLEEMPDKTSECETSGVQRIQTPYSGWCHRHTQNLGYQICWFPRWCTHQIYPVIIAPSQLCSKVLRKRNCRIQDQYVEKMTIQCSAWHHGQWLWSLTFWVLLILPLNLLNVLCMKCPWPKSLRFLIWLSQFNVLCFAFPSPPPCSCPSTCSLSCSLSPLLSLPPFVSPLILSASFPLSLGEWDTLIFFCILYSTWNTHILLLPLFTYILHKHLRGT